MTSQGQEYAERYRIEYQRDDGGKWFKFHNRRGEEVRHERQGCEAREARR